MNDFLDKYQGITNKINIAYNELRNLSNDEFRNSLSEIEFQINSSENKTNVLDEYIIQVFAIVKESARRFSEGNIIVTANARDRLLAKLYDFVEIKEHEAIYKNHWDVESYIKHSNLKKFNF